MCRYLDSLKAGTKRGAFDKQERELLLQLVEKHGVGQWYCVVLKYTFDSIMSATAVQLYRCSRCLSCVRSLGEDCC